MVFFLSIAEFPVALKKKKKAYAKQTNNPIPTPAAPKKTPLNTFLEVLQ